MADGIINIDVELNETEFRASLEDMGSIVQRGSQRMIGSIDELSSNFKILPSNIDRVFGTVPTLVGRVINNIASNNPVMADTGYEFFASMTGRLPDSVADIVRAMPQITNNVTDTLQQDEAFIVDAGYNFFGSLIDRLPDSIADIIGVMPDITLGITDKLEREEMFVADAGFFLFTSLIDELPDALRFILRAPREIVDTMVEAFTGMLYRFSDIGSNIVQGVWNGILNMASWLSSQVSNFFSGIISGVTNFLGIRSPSALFRDRIGKNIALGIGAGIAEEMPNVARDMVRHINSLVSTADKLSIGNIGLSGSFSGQRANSNGGDLRGSSAENNGEAPVINITFEPSGDLRGFFEYLSMNIKRADYLSGGNYV